MRLSLHILAVNLNLLTVSNCCGAQRNLCSYPAICILFVAERRVAPKHISTDQPAASSHWARVNKSSPPAADTRITATQL